MKDLPKVLTWQLEVESNQRLSGFRTEGTDNIHLTNHAPIGVIPVGLEPWSVATIHSDHIYSASSSPLLLKSAPDTARILCRSITRERHRQLQVKVFPQGPYVAARAGFDPLRLKAIDLTNALPRPTGWGIVGVESKVPSKLAHISRETSAHN